MNKGHRWWSCPWRGMQWLTFCKGCGLVVLKNARTTQAMKAACDGGDA